MMKYLIALICCSFGMNMLYSADSVGWRMDASGHFDVEKAPLQWNENENLVWRTKMPAWSNTSPIIVGDNVFTCAEPATLVCVNKADGSILWQKSNTYIDLLEGEKARQAQALMQQAQPWIDELKQVDRTFRQVRRQLRRDRGNQELKQQAEELQAKKDALEDKINSNPLIAQMRKPDTHAANGYCSYIPVSDGKHVYAAFGLGTLACYDLSGKRIWAVTGQKPTNRWGGSSSPLLVDGLVIIGFHDYVAYDAQSGEERWRTEMPKESFGTPVCVDVSGESVIITPQGMALKASDGTVLSDDLFEYLPYNAPVIHNGIIYAVGGHDQQCSAVKLPDTLAGEFEKLWSLNVDKNRYYASPLLHDGLLYVLHRSGQFTVLNASDGSVIKTIKVEGMKGNGVYTSPTFAGSHIYIGDEAGLVVIFEAGTELKEIGRVTQEGTRCNPVFEGDNMYVRTKDHLMCIGAP